MFILDCSVTIGAFFKDENSEYAMRVVGSIGSTKAFVPVIWFYEVGNTLLIGERRKRISEIQRIEILDALVDLPINMPKSPNPNELGKIITLGKTLELTFYDAAYLNMALTEGLPLATLDMKMRAAAKQANVSLYEP